MTTSTQLENKISEWLQDPRRFRGSLQGDISARARSLLPPIQQGFASVSLQAALTTTRALSAPRSLQSLDALGQRISHLDLTTREEFKDRAFACRLLATGIQGATHLVDAAVSTQQHAVRTSLLFAPIPEELTQKASVLLKRKAKQLLDATGVTPHVKKAFEALGRTVYVTLPMQMSREFGISEEEAREQVTNLCVVIPFLIPGGQTGQTVGRATVRALIPKAFQRAVKISEESILARDRVLSSALFSSTSPLEGVTKTQSRHIEQMLLAVDALAKPKYSLHKSIELHIEKIAAYFPRVGKRDQSQREIWLQAIGENISSSTPKFHEYGTERNLVYRLSLGKKRYVIKDCDDPVNAISELIGLQAVENMGIFKHMVLPKPIAMGQYISGEESRYFIIKTHMEGKCLGDWVKATTSKVYGSTERTRLFQITLESAEQIGKALGELHAKPTAGQALSKKLVSQEIGEFKDCLESAKNKLKESGLFSETLFEETIRDFYESPGPLTYGIGDAHWGQMTYCDKSKKCGLIDTEHVSYTMRGSKQPLIFPNDEQVEMLRHLSEFTELHFEEFAQVREAFTKGYFSEFSGQAAAEQFFTMKKSLDNTWTTQ